MSQPLCRECGHPLPNAAGSGVYCVHCGTPVNPDESPRQGHFMTTYGRVGVAVHKITENDVLVVEVLGPLGGSSHNRSLYFASRSLDVIGQAVASVLGLNVTTPVTAFNTMKDAVEQCLALEQADQLSTFMTKGKSHE